MLKFLRRTFTGDPVAVDRSLAFFLMISSKNDDSYEPEHPVLGCGT
jgi:hypothetical protein